MSILKQSQSVMAAVLLAGVMLTGCGLIAGGAPAERAEVTVTSDRAGAPAKVEVGAAKEMPAAEPAYMADEAVAAPEMELAAMPTASFAPGSEASTDAYAPQQTPALRAGEVDDNAQWDDYLLFRRNYAGPGVHNRDISERYVIEVTDGQGYPVLGAQVSVMLPGQKRQEIFSAVTPADGRVLFHPLALDAALEQIDSFPVTVTFGQTSQQFVLSRIDAQPATSFTDVWRVALNAPGQPAQSLNLDVLFLVDATGSMADEIAKIQNTIFDVSAQIDALPENPNVRYGLVTYRDRDDSFVTHSYEFTPDVRDFSANLNTVRADGGGDYPESLNEGLHNALHKVEWRGAETVKLIFLIADAPPHLDYAQDYDYAVEMDTAARRGIKIFPIASSGLDDQGEYIFRQMAQYTQGRFIFLTYADDSNSGAPGDVTTHHVDDYSVENLDRLLVRLVEEELAYQGRPLARAQ